MEVLENYEQNRQLLRFASKTREKVVNVVKNQIENLRNVKVEFSLLVKFN